MVPLYFISMQITKKTSARGGQVIARMKIEVRRAPEMDSISFPNFKHRRGVGIAMKTKSISTSFPSSASSA